MSDKIDTSPEAVERLANDHDTVGNDPAKYIMGHPHHWKTAKVLRKLSARVAELEAKNRELALEVISANGQALDAYDAQKAAEQRAETAEAKLERAMQIVEMIASADVDAVLGEAVDLSCEIIGELLDD